MTRCLPKRRRRGAALVEFALVSSLLCLLLFGIIEIGFLLGDQSLVSAAAREAARAAAAGEAMASAKSRGVLGGTGVSLTPANVALETSADGGATWTALGDSGTGNSAVSGSLVRATVTYSHPLTTGLIFSGSVRTLTARLVMRRE